MHPWVPRLQISKYATEWDESSLDVLKSQLNDSLYDEVGNGNE